MKRILIVLMLLSVLLALVACTQTTPTATDTAAPTATEASEVATATPANGNMYQVVIENEKFMPTDSQIKAGDSVEFVNKDETEHTVTLESGDFDQKLAVGGKATYTFTEKGTFGYFCSIHPGMKGTIIVS